MINLIDVYQPSWEKANKYFGFLKTKNKQTKKNPFLGTNYRTLRWQLSLSFFAYVLLGQACKLHVFCTATTDT